MQVSYCEGWDSGKRQALGSLSSVRAEERDRVGEQYTVVLSFGERPMAMIDVAWADYYCAVWLFDEQLRRIFQTEFRRLAKDRVFMTHSRWWTYADDTQAEFDEQAVTRTAQLSLDGRLEIETRPGPRGGVQVTVQQVSPQTYWCEVPVFGDWRLFAEFLPGLGHEVAPNLTFSDTPVTHGEGLPADQRPWRPPRPLRPAQLDRMFQEGTRYRLGQGAEVVVETQQAGPLRLTSGRLIAADPGWLVPDLEPFTAAVAAGEYPVDISLIRFVDEPDHCRTVAAKLTIHNEPVASWEMALRPGQDPRLLGEKEFFGFGVDAGMGCFFDASAAEGMARTVEETDGDVFLNVHAGQIAEISDPASSANLIAFSSGWGDGAYPTWIGRTADGEVACFIADMLVVHDAEILS